MEVKQLRQLLRYEPETGKLFWLPRSGEHFSDGPKLSASQRATAWNSRFSGKEAFTVECENGYRRGKIFDQKLYAHRVIWALVNGFWPTEQIDHINGDRSENRIENLREATASENARNIRLKRANVSGAHGVTWHKTKGCWQSIIKHGGKLLHLGYFENREEAISVRANAQLSIGGFHENHGRAF